MFDILTTATTYKTRENALKKLHTVMARFGKDSRGNVENIRYMIAVNEEGRFAPVVITRDAFLASALPHHGITVTN